ncbi:MAG: hypothetical protein ACLUB2_05695 [Butyricicoccus pullicaecorum]
MNDYLHFTMDDADIGRLSSLALAHVGDCVYELLTRGRLVTGGLTTARNLHSHTVALVRASAQYRRRRRSPMLTEESPTSSAARQSRCTACPRPHPRPSTRTLPRWKRCSAGCTSKAATSASMRSMTSLHSPKHK